MHSVVGCTVRLDGKTAIDFKGSKVCPWMNSIKNPHISPSESFARSFRKQN